MTFAEHVLSFYRSLKIPSGLPNGVETLNPYRNDVTFDLCRRFYKKYFDDHNERRIIIGINPGRYGAGLTGIPFTDPVKLEQVCSIANDLPKKAELSADFIHAMISHFGGAEKFFSSYYFSSVSPLGFTREGKNLNYYDLPALASSLKPFIIQSLQKQLTFRVSRNVAFCLGEGSNYKFLSALNQDHQFFKEIVPLAHPRFIMQYKRKKMDEYITDYVDKLIP